MKSKLIFGNASVPSFIYKRKSDEFTLIFVWSKLLAKHLFRFHSQSMRVVFFEGGTANTESNKITVFIM